MNKKPMAVHEVAKLTGITTRTLHYYDEICSPYKNVAKFSANPSLIIISPSVMSFFHLTN